MSVLGKVSVPDGKSGPWSISTFEVSEEAAMRSSIRAAVNNTPEMIIYAGTYKRLVHEKRGVVMSNTTMEIQTAYEVTKATGRVLVNGLGLGMVLEYLLSKADVTYVRVVEVDPDVIALVSPTFAHDPRVEIVNADAYEYAPAKGERFDFVWHDIWDDISDSNLADMTRLVRKYQSRAARQGVWSRDLARRMRRRFKRDVERASFRLAILGGGLPE